MAFARDRYSASGGQTDFTITFPYLAEDDVTVTQEGAALTQDTDYTIVSSTTVRLTSGATAGDIVIITRQTSQSARIVDYTTASTLTEEDLDNDSLQAFYLVQEALDAAELSLAVDQDNLWDAAGARIIEVAEPTADQDAATKAYVDEVLVLAGTNPVPSEADDGNVLVVTTEGAVDWLELSEAYIPDGLIDAGMLADGTITATEIAANTITEAELANESVTGLVLEDASVNTEHLINESVTGLILEDASVNTEHLINEAVTGLILEDASVNTEHFVALGVTEAALAAEAVTLAKLESAGGTEGYFLKNEETTSVVWAPATGGSWTQLTPAATTSGTSVVIAAQNSIPATAKEIRIMLIGVSTNTANTGLWIQFTDTSNATIAANYSVDARVPGSGAQNATTRISLSSSDSDATTDAADLTRAFITLTRMSPSTETWSVFGMSYSSQYTNQVNHIHGNLVFGATPLRGAILTTSAGTATFDAGTAYVAYFD